MVRRTAALLVMSLLAAGRAAAEDRKVVVEDGDARAEIAEGAEGLSVGLTVGAKSAEWKYQGLTLDPEETGAPAAEYVSWKSGRLLLVRAYSGGAHCCWSLLAFDAERMTALGQVLDGQSPVELVQGQKSCPVAAVAEPVDRKKGQPTPRKLYCFTGRRFQAKGPAPR